MNREKKLVIVLLCFWQLFVVSLLSAAPIGKAAEAAEVGEAGEAVEAAEAVEAGEAVEAAEAVEAGEAGKLGEALPSLLTPEEILAEQQKNIDWEELERFLHEVDREIGDLLPAGSLRQLVEKIAAGELQIAPEELLSSIMTFFWRELIVNLSVLGKLLLIAVICALLQSLQSAFEQGTVAKLAHFVCFLVVITLAAGSFKLAMGTGLAAIEKMVGFMQVLLPILLVLLTTLGGLTTVSLLQPFLLVFLSFMSTFCQSVVFPLIGLAAVLAIVNHLSETFKISQLVSLFKQFTKVGLGLVLTLFIGVITVEGVAGSVLDGVTLRTAKYMTGAFVPVAGGMFADALDAVIGGSLILKNALGLAGVLVLGAIVLFPVLKILALAVLYRLASALMQPLGDSLLANTLEDFAGCLFLTFAVVAAVAMMFFMTIAIIVGAANFTVMLR